MTDETTQVSELSLDEALGSQGDKPEVETPKAEAQAEAEDKTTETPATPAGDEKDSKDPSWHLKAVLDEREKRQAAQREAQELRSQLEALKKGDDKPKTSVFEDEGKFRNELVTDFEVREVNARMNMSQALAEDKWGADKVATALATFKELAKDNPELGKDVAADPLPYFKLMKLVERHEKAKQIEAVTTEGYEKSLREKIRAEVEAELKAKQEEADGKRKSVSPSLATKRSEGGVKESLHLISLGDVLTD